MNKLIFSLAILLMISIQPQAQQIQGCGTMISQIECTYFEFQGMNCKLNLADSISFPSGSHFYIEGNLRLNCNEQFCPFTSVPHCIDVDFIAVCDTTPDCDNQMPGDLDNNGNIDIADVTFLMGYIYSGGPAPFPLANGDPNGDCRINIGDGIFLSAFISGGPAPVDCTCNTPVSGQDGCCYGIRGNVDYDPQDLITISDLVDLAFRMFGDGPAPLCSKEVDVDASDPFGYNFDIADLVYLVEYMFGGGPAPESCL